MRKVVMAGMALAMTGALAWVPQISQGAGYGSVSHIHGVTVFGDKVLFSTHEGLYQHLAANSMKKISSEDFDVMGLAAYGQTMYASGHPGVGSREANPLGLLSSADGGKSWKKISLQGQVDFHMLEVGKRDMYGADSTSGQLMYSSDSGKKWRKLGANQYSDIAVITTKSANAYGLRSGALVRTSDAFATTFAIKTALKWSSVETLGSTVYASSGKAIYRSTDNGKSWKKFATLPAEISSISFNKEIFVAVTSDAILISRDGGKSFTS